MGAPGPAPGKLNAGKGQESSKMATKTKVEAKAREQSFNEDKRQLLSRIEGLVN
jgi:hypothetical protein